MEEQWMPVAGFERAYSVSDRGRVRSEARWILRGPGGKARTWEEGRILRTTRNASGRASVTLCLDGIRAERRVAPLVLEAFVGPRPDGLDCCHNNGDCSDDRLVNLRWDTRQENQIDTVRHGTHHYAHVSECKRGHALSGNNVKLVPNGRTCRSCQLTHGWARKVDVATDSPAWIAEADRRYAELMERPDGHPFAIQEQCKRGHDRVEPNLIISGNRADCRACSNTRAWAFHRKIAASDPRWQKEADRRYAQIMNS